MSLSNITKRKRVKWTKEKVKEESKNAFYVLLGCFLLAVADSLFIIPCEIVNGGIDSVGVLIDFYCKSASQSGLGWSDIAMGVTQVILWLVGLIILGKKFSLYTLLGSLAFPVFYSILLRSHFIDLVGMSDFYARHMVGGELELSALLIAAIIGGILSGLGVAFTYIGNGSMGGFDVLSFVIAKYTSIKQDISGLGMDITTIVIGALCMRQWELCFVGVVSAICCAIAINVVFIKGQESLMIDIITDKPEAIIKFITEDLEHKFTMVDINSDVKNKVGIRVIVNKNEELPIKKFVSSVDSNAFVYTSSASSVNGGDFAPFKISHTEKNRILEKYGIKTKKNSK